MCREHGDGCAEKAPRGGVIQAAAATAAKESPCMLSRHSDEPATGSMRMGRPPVGVQAGGAAEPPGAKILAVPLLEEAILSLREATSRPGGRGPPKQLDRAGSIERGPTAPRA